MEAVNRSKQELEDARRLVLMNYHLQEYENDKGETKFRQIAKIAADIWNDLRAMTDNCVKRVQGRVFANGNNRICYFEGADELFGWLPTKDIHADWSKKFGLIGKGEFLKYISHVADQYEFASALPHYPAVPGFYYVRNIKPEHTGKLDELVAFFSPATNKDRALIKSAIITPFWGGPFGNRPAFVIDGLETDDQGNRGVGKTALTDSIGFLCGGEIDLSKKSDISDIRKMMLTAEDVRLVRFDNIKEETLSSEAIESLITAPAISGHRMYHGYDRVPNWFSYFITFNDASLSKDMSQRAMIIRLARPKYDPFWWPQLIDFIKINGDAIIADIGAILTAEISPFKTATRFPVWEQGVLARCTDDLITVQTAIAVDREAVDETVSLKEEFGDHCYERIATMVKNNPSGSTFGVRKSWVVGWLQKFDCNRKLSRKSANKLLMRLLPQAFLIEPQLYRGIDYLIWVGARHDGNIEFTPTGCRRIESGEDGIFLSTWPFKTGTEPDENADSYDDIPL